MWCEVFLCLDVRFDNGCVSWAGSPRVLPFPALLDSSFLNAWCSSTCFCVSLATVILDCPRMLKLEQGLRRA